MRSRKVVLHDQMCIIHYSCLLVRTCLYYYKANKEKSVNPNLLISNMLLCCCNI